MKSCNQPINLFDNKGFTMVRPTVAVITFLINSDECFSAVCHTCGITRHMQDLYIVTKHTEHKGIQVFLEKGKKI